MRVTNDEIFDNTEFILNKIIQCKFSPLPLGEGLGVRAVWENNRIGGEGCKSNICEVSGVR